MVTNETISREQYLTILRQLSFKKNVCITACIMSVDLCLLFLAIHFLQKNTLIHYLTAQPILAIVLLHSFILLHEAGHNAAAQKKISNYIIGHFTSILCCMPFFTWKYIHNEHHKWTGHLDNDPVFELLKRAKIKGKLPFIMHLGWRSFLPIGVFFLHLVYWSYPLKLIIQRQINRKIFINCLFSVLFLAAAYYSLHLASPNLFKFTNFLPAIIIYGILWETLSTPQHIGLASTKHKPSLQDHINTTRSTSFPIIIEKYLFLNFGLHVEHHLYPNLPWHELKKVQTLIQPYLTNGYKLVKGGIWNIKTRSTNMESFLGIKK